jgi:hypothetical protein
MARLEVCPSPDARRTGEERALAEKVIEGSFGMLTISGKSSTSFPFFSFSGKDAKTAPCVLSSRG